MKKYTVVYPVCLFHSDTLINMHVKHIICTEQEIKDPAYMKQHLDGEDIYKVFEGHIQNIEL